MKSFKKMYKNRPKIEKS